MDGESRARWLYTRVSGKMPSLTKNWARRGMWIYPVMTQTARAKRKVSKKSFRRVHRSGRCDCDTYDQSIDAEQKTRSIKIK